MRQSKSKLYLLVVMVCFYGILAAGAYGADADFNVVMGPVDDRADSHVLTIGDAIIGLEADAIPIPDTWVYTKKDNSMIEDQALYTKTGGVFVTKNTDTNAHAHVRGLELESFEYSGKMMVTASTGGIGITFLSDYPNTDSYYRIRGYGGRTMHLAPHPQTAVDKGEFVFQGVIDSGFKPKEGTWIRFKIRVVVEPAGTRIQAMLWDDGKLQPSAWQINAIDTSARRYVKGTIGLWSSGPGEKTWSDLRLRRLEYVSETEVIGVNNFPFSRDLQPGTYQVTVLSAVDYQTLISKPSDPFEWVLEEPEPEEILIEVTKPTVIRIIVK